MLYKSNPHSLHLINRLEEAPYDPILAAELQFQALLGNPKGGSLGAAGLGSGMLGSTGSLKYVGLGHDLLEDPIPMKHRSKGRSNTLSTLSLTSLDFDTSSLLSKGLDSPEIKRSSRFNRSPEGQSGTSPSKKSDSMSLWKWSASPPVERKSSTTSAFRSPITIDPPYDTLGGIGSPSLFRKSSWESTTSSSPGPNRKSSWETTSSYRSTSPLRKQSWDSSPPRSPSPNSRKFSWSSSNRSPSPTSRKSSYGSPPARSQSPTHKSFDTPSSRLDSSSTTSSLLSKLNRKTSPQTNTPSSPFSPRRFVN